MNLKWRQSLFLLVGMHLVSFKVAADRERTSHKINRIEMQ